MTVAEAPGPGERRAPVRLQIRHFTDARPVSAMELMEGLVR